MVDWRNCPTVFGIVRCLYNRACTSKKHGNSQAECAEQGFHSAMLAEFITNGRGCVDGQAIGDKRYGKDQTIHGLPPRVIRLRILPSLNTCITFQKFSKMGLSHRTQNKLRVLVSHMKRSDTSSVHNEKRIVLEFL